MEISRVTAGQICAVYDCNNYSWQNNSRSFFRFPKDREICFQWILKARRGDLYERFKKQGPEKLYKSNRICDAHFKQEDFRNPNLKSQGLKKGTVPSLLLPISKNGAHKRNLKESNLEYDTPISEDETLSDINDENVEEDNNEFESDNNNSGMLLDSKISNYNKKRVKLKETLLKSRLVASEKQITQLKKTIIDLQRENALLRRQSTQNKKNGNIVLGKPKPKRRKKR